MKKVFFLINSLEGGGAERVVLNFSKELSKKYDVTIITLKDSFFYELPENIRYISFSKIKSNFLMFLFLPVFVIKFKKLLKKEQFDTGISFLEISNFVNLLSGNNSIISFRTSIDFFQGIVGIIYKTLIRILYKRAKKIVVNSEENRFSIANYLGIDIKKIFTIYNPFDCSKRLVGENKYILDELSNKLKGKKVFVTVGRLIWQKNHHLILKAFSKLIKNNFNDFVLLIVGGGQKKEELESLSIDLGLQKNIVFLGEQKNVFKYLNCADYFVYASSIEGFPNVLIEAMSMDLPIITSVFKTGALEVITGSFDEKLDGEIKFPYFSHNGVLLDINNYEKNFFDIYKVLGKVKQEKVGFEKFDIKNSVKILDEILFS